MTRKIILLLICICLTPIVCFADCRTTTTQWSRCDAENSCKYYGLGLDDQDCVAIIKADSLAWVVWYGRDKCRSHNCTEEQKLQNDYDRVKLGYMNKEAKEFNAREQEKEREKKLKEQRKREAEQKRVKIDLVVKEHGNFRVYTIDDRGYRRQFWATTAYDDQDVYSFNSSGFVIRQTYEYGGSKYIRYVCNHYDCKEDWRR